MQQQTWDTLYSPLSKITTTTQMCYVPPTARHFIIVHHTSQKNKRGEKKFVVVSHNGPLLFIEKCDFVSRQKHIHSLVFGRWMYNCIYFTHCLYIYQTIYLTLKSQKAPQCIKRSRDTAVTTSPGCREQCQSACVLTTANTYWIDVFFFILQQFASFLHFYCAWLKI